MAQDVMERTDEARREAVEEGARAPVPAAADAVAPAPDARRTELPVDEELDYWMEQARQGRVSEPLEAGRLRYGVARRIRALRATLADLDAEQSAVVDEIAARRARTLQRLADAEALAMSLAEQHFEERGEKHLDLPGGVRVQGKTVSAGWDITDREAFLAALNAEDRDEVAPPRPHFLVSEAKRWLDAHLTRRGGDLESLPPGVERTEERVSWSVRVQS